LRHAEPLADTALALTRRLPLTGLWLLLAFVIGLALDALGAQRVVNLLAPPLWSMLAWNLLIYVVLVGHALRSAMTRGGALATPGPLRQGLGRLLITLGQRLHGLTDRQASPAIGRFLADWWRVGQALNAARLATLIHLAAAALACGVLLSMYARGVFFDFRAGWESTFFDAPAMHGLLSILLAPASWISGLALPTVTEFSALRMPGGAGESARRWIHLFAITVGLVVIAPRLMLAALCAWQARQRALALPIPLDDAYFTRLVRGMRGDSVSAQVLPYNYQAATALKPALQRVLEGHLGVRVNAEWTASLPLGAEDALDVHLPTAAPPQLTVVVFAMTATPERETHRAVVAALAARRGPGADLLVVVDESGFRQRQTGTGATQRVQDRRAAWREALQGVSAALLFADLSRAEVGA
jgi:hypothetical protein